MEMPVLFDHRTGDLRISTLFFKILDALKFGQMEKNKTSSLLVGLFSIHKVRGNIYPTSCSLNTLNAPGSSSSELSQRLNVKPLVGFYDQGSIVTRGRQQNGLIILGS